MTEYVQTYKCPTCGLTASGSGHLCHPGGQGAPFTCKFCGKTVDDPRHVCPTMLNKMEYICKKCGRLAIYDSLLCEPATLDGD